ncbi:Aste57867_15187 [Aphanomyces stellatus]|uniref:glucan 1,3-beta-glucosidase n=1 Tax=Aphanomyces stellatus TaxID=120398 RepID=A0A485L355_9STRA|nr:hypothetical protein As57867_015131 [Aphanomyces stellatus]VFT91996.1 Aste57867_15187 [Aphanomyces stellatus]
MWLSSWLLVVAAMPFVVLDAMAQHVQPMVRSGAVPSRGVNLGGWLVVEYWMSKQSPIWKDVPENVANGGEYQVMKHLGHAKGDDRFRQHRDAWITADDIAEIARYGLNTVRVPVGWWIMPNYATTTTVLVATQYINYDSKLFAPGALGYLDALVNDWAVRYNVSVLVDIHSAPGSQNGRDHSAAPVLQDAAWTRQAGNVERTLEVAQFLADRYHHSLGFLGLELLNEPEGNVATNQGVNRPKLLEYYTNAVRNIRATGNNCVLVVSPLLTEQSTSAGPWATFLRQQLVWHDWHKYLKWGFEGQSLTDIATRGVDDIARDISVWPGNAMFIGEWSLGHPDSANGGFQDKSQVKRYAANLVRAVNTAKAGWTFWSWRADTGLPFGEGWSMRDLLREGLLKLE